MRQRETTTLLLILHHVLTLCLRARRFTFCIPLLIPLLLQALSVEEPSTKANATARKRMHAAIDEANAISKSIYAAFKSDENSLASLLQSAEESGDNVTTKSPQEVAGSAMNSATNYGKKLLVGRDRAAR